MQTLGLQRQITGLGNIDDYENMYHEHTCIPLENTTIKDYRSKDKNVVYWILLTVKKANLLDALYTL